MIILALTLAAWAILRKYAKKPVKQIAPVVAPISPAELQRREKERERVEKAEQQREQAESEFDRLTAQRETVLALCEAIEQELNTCTSNTRRTQLLSKLVTNENRLANIDRRRDRAYAAFAA